MARLNLPLPAVLRVGGPHGLNLPLLAVSPGVPVSTAGDDPGRRRDSAHGTRPDAAVRVRRPA